VVWREDKTAALISGLAAGTLDAALLALEADIGDVERELIVRDAFVIAAPPGHPLATKTAPASLADLRGSTVLLLDDGHCFRDQALSLCGRVRASSARPASRRWLRWWRAPPA
jgi:LysR family hydrogen peroxide-inducible transcriptional activator